MKWETIDQNSILWGDGFYVSYLSDTSNISGFGSLFAGDGGMDETAIVVKIGDKTNYYILNGDWRNQYENAVSDGLEACMNIFRKNNKEYGSGWSDEE